MSNRDLIVRIDSSVQGEASVTRTLTGYLVQQLLDEVGGRLVEHDLGRQPLPAVTAEQLRSIHGSLEPADVETAAQLALSDQLIGELKQARALVIGAPMYNFGIPASLKAWIDHVARARQTFRYTESGPEGLTGIEDGYIVVSSGGTPIGSDADYVSGYLRHVLRFIGVKRIHVIDGSGSKREVDATLAAARRHIDAILPAAAKESVES